MNDTDAELAAVLHSYGEDWQIMQDGETHVWSAVQRPTPTALHVIIGVDLPDLRAKLDRAG